MFRELTWGYFQTGIVSEALCPSLAVVDPRVTLTMPATVVASSGFDVLSHAIESYTAKPYSQRIPAQPRHRRPLNQGFIDFHFPNKEWILISHYLFCIDIIFDCLSIFINQERTLTLIMGV